jgi:hypothetical protein
MRRRIQLRSIVRGSGSLKCPWGAAVGENDETEVQHNDAGNGLSRNALLQRWTSPFPIVAGDLVSVNASLGLAWQAQATLTISHA